MLDTCLQRLSFRMPWRVHCSGVTFPIPKFAQDKPWHLYHLSVSSLLTSHFMYMQTTMVAVKWSHGVHLNPCGMCRPIIFIYQWHILILQDLWTNLPVYLFLKIEMKMFRWPRTWWLWWTMHTSSMSHLGRHWSSVPGTTRSSWLWDRWLEHWRQVSDFHRISSDTLTVIVWKLAYFSVHSKSSVNLWCTG